MFRSSKCAAIEIWVLLATMSATTGLSGCSSQERLSKSSAYPTQVGYGDYTRQQGNGRFKLGKPYYIDGKRYVPRQEPDYEEIGIASWYGKGFNGRPTANGEIYDSDRLTAAHRTLPLPSLVKVTNLANGRQLIVRVNDRGPFAGNRIIDLSRRAADLLGIMHQGLGHVRVEYLQPAPLNGSDYAERRYAETLPGYRSLGLRRLGRSGE